MGTTIAIDELASFLLKKDGDARILVGIAGPPGVGKSTFCARLQAILNNVRPGTSAIVPMDGFHFDDSYLAEKGWLARKGAPHTFDIGGLVHAIERLRANLEAYVAVPVFDRGLEIARAGARIIPREVKIVLVEGNYLLLKAPAWADLAQQFDVSVMLRADVNVLSERLGARWVDAGMTSSQTREKLEGNDMGNVRQVLQNSRDADFVIRTDRVSC